MADEIKLLHRQRGAIKHKLTNFVSFLNPLKKMHAEREALNDVQIADLKFRVENLRLVHTDFEQIQTKIENICDESNLTEEFDQRSNFFDTISNVLAQAQVILDSCISVHSQIKVESPNMLSHIQGVKLPTINLPKFQGNYDSWLEFKDLFESLINSNQSISKIQKFHYLKASLELDAAKIIQSLEFTSENYDVAWELLCSRYNNSKLLVHNHIKSIFELEPITKESSVALRRLVDNLYKHLRALEVLKQPTIHWDALLVFLISSKLDRSTAREWERFKMSCNSLKLDDIKDFLYKRADFLETFELNHGSKSIKNNNYGTNKHYSLISTNHKCNFCKKQHLIYSCPDFLQLTVPERIEKVKDLKLCENCLCTGHSVNKCKLRSCKICKNRHSSLLHQVKETAVVPDSSVVMSSHDKQSSVLLPTVRLYVYDANGSMHLVKAVLDSGSQSNFISAKMCNKLGLNKEPTHVSIAGINDSGSTFNHKCQIKIKSIYNDYSVKLTCLVIPQIAGNLPAYEIDTVDWKIPSTIQLADPDFSKPSEVDLLLGASHFCEFLERGQLQLSKHLPVLQNTKFGWIASGLVPKNASQLHCYFSQNISCDLRQFWEIEEHECPTQLSKDDADCERFFKETITRQDDGRFIVRIPLKYPSSQLGDSKQSAIKRLLQLEHRFISDPILKEEYSRFMQEYLDLGHMTKIKETSSNDYFLPHHGVVRKSSLTTKLRVVFNGSAQSSSGWSVNDLHHVGPPVHTQLFSILLQFRQHPIAVCADIEKMYRQILVHPDDRHLQNIVWRFDSDLEIDTYSLNTITYGTASAPYLAIRCLKQLAHEVENEYPVISNIINNHFYVDDLIISFTSEEDAIATCKTLKMILQQACFPLRKWISNSSNVSQFFKDENDPTSVISFSHDKQIKTLGVVWNNISDTFSYQISANSSISPITKRIILSEISKVFDPLGLASPCIILAKIIIQQLWTLHLDWDDTVPIDLYEKWINFREQLHVLNSIQIPRHVTCSNPVSVEIHGFCDSSNSAYGSSIYIRSIDNFGNTHVNLLCAKKVTRSCVTCFKSKPHAINPIMANLPRERVTETPAFSIVGVDYAGPILIKDRRGRGSKVSKGYICLFVCFVSKAVHLELSSDLSTQSFLASLKRFISRRGKPTQIWSDNGTNFKGAQKELYDLFQFFKAHEHDIVSHCAMESFTWKFIPPNSPHFGGLWESGIKTVKFHLKRVLQETKLTYEELYTVLTQIESVLNSRPLYPLSSDPNDLTPLTPSHLLIGRPLTTLPEMNLQPVPINRLSRVQFLQSLYQSFWKRWSTEYLSILQQRSKWKHPGQRLQIGALVLIKQENLPPSQWILGRITEVHPDSEGVVRVASVRTSKGIYKRAVVKLCPLPITEEQPERKPD